MLITSLSIISSMSLTFLNIYLISKMLQKKIELKFKNIAIILVLAITVVISSKIQDNLMATLIRFILLSVTTYLVFKEPIDKCVISSIMFYIVLFICDILTVLIEKIINLDYNTLSISERKLIGDAIVIVMIFVISKILPVIYLFQKIIDNIKIKVLNYICLALIVISVIYLFLYYNVVNKSIDEISINIIMVLLIICTFIKFSLERIKKQNITKEYDKMSEYVKVYEDVIEKDRIRRHENKNQLITIKGMISEKDQKTHEYIDSLIDDNSDKSYKWISELTNIPIGGLKGLLFYKVNQMRESGIEVSLTISRSLE